MFILTLLVNNVKFRIFDFLVDFSRAIYVEALNFVVNTSSLNRQSVIVNCNFDIFKQRKRRREREIERERERKRERINEKKQSNIKTPSLTGGVCRLSFMKEKLQTLKV